MSELTQFALGLALLALIYWGWRSLSDFRAGRFVQVCITASIIAVLALGLVFFILNCARAIVGAVQAENLWLAALLIAVGGFAVLFYGVLFRGVWIAFAKFVSNKIGVKIPGHQSRL